jgi:hypothetical protein
LVKNCRKWSKIACRKLVKISGFLGIYVSEQQINPWRSLSCLVWSSYGSALRSVYTNFFFGCATILRLSYETVFCSCDPIRKVSNFPKCSDDKSQLCTVFMYVRKQALEVLC